MGIASSILFMALHILKKVHCLLPGCRSKVGSLHEKSIIAFAFGDRGSLISASDFFYLY